MSKRSIPHQLPCHSSTVHVTHRHSKQLERPRNHTCKECGQQYAITARGDKVVECKPA